MPEGAFGRGVQRYIQMQQLRQGGESQRMRGRYMESLMQGQQFKRGQALKKERQWAEFAEGMESQREVIPGALEGFDPFLTPGMGTEEMVRETPMDYGALARGLVGMGEPGAGMTALGQIPTELDIYEAQTRRMGAMPKTPISKIPTPPGKFSERLEKGKVQDWIADGAVEAGKYPGYKRVGKPYTPSAEKPKAAAPPSLVQQQRATVVEINEIIDRYGGKIDFIALAQMDKQQRGTYLKQQQMDLLKRVKEPKRTRLRRLYKKLERQTESIVGPLPTVEEEKILTPELAAEFLMEAEGNKERARQLATERGYRW